MNHLKRILIIFFLFVPMLFTIGTAKAQEAVSTSGNHAENGTAQLSWTIGETVSKTISNGDNSLTQGMHQGKLTVTAIKDAVGSGLKATAFPNPAKEWIHLKIDHLSQRKAGDLWKDYSFQLYDQNGKLLRYEKIEGPETVIPMDRYAPSSFFLKLLDNHKEIKSFKIIKH